MPRIGVWDLNLNLGLKFMVSIANKDIGPRNLNPKLGSGVPP